MKIVSLLIVVLSFVVASCGNYYPPKPVEPSLLPVKETQVYKALGARYEYTVERTVQGSSWDLVLIGKCQEGKVDESLPSRPFRAIDYGETGKGFDHYWFTDGEPSSEFERNMLVAQVHRAVRLTFRKGNLVSTKKL